MELEPPRPSPPGGSPGTGGPGRAGTAAAEGRLLGWTEGEEEEEVDVQRVRGDDEKGEEGGSAGRGHEEESPAEPGSAGWGRVGPPSDSGCQGSGIGEVVGSERRRERGRDGGLGRGEEAEPAGRGREDGGRTAEPAQRQTLKLRPGRCWGRKLLQLGEKTGPGPPQTGTVEGTGPGAGAGAGVGGGRQRPGFEGEGFAGQKCESGSVAERPLQCGTEVGVGAVRYRTQRERTGPQSESVASPFGFVAEQAWLGSHPGLKRPGFGSGTQRPGSGFGIETPEDESGTARPGFGGSEMLSGYLRYLAKNFVLKPVESSGLEQHDGSERERRSSGLKRRVDWGIGGQRRQAGRIGGRRREGGSPEQQ